MRAGCCCNCGGCTVTGCSGTPSKWARSPWVGYWANSASISSRDRGSCRLLGEDMCYLIADVGRAQWLQSKTIKKTGKQLILQLSRSRYNATRCDHEAIVGETPIKHTLLQHAQLMLLACICGPALRSCSDPLSLSKSTAHTCTRNGYRANVAARQTMATG